MNNNSTALMWEAVESNSCVLGTKLAVAQEKVLYAEERAGFWLAKANELKERGLKDKAEPLYQKSARWLMRANKLRKW